jgi:hypothetical protein
MGFALSMLQEIAAQFAELNDHLRARSNPLTNSMTIRPFEYREAPDPRR